MPYESLCVPCRPPAAGPTPPQVGYGYLERITGPWLRRLDVAPAHGGSEHLPRPPSRRLVNKVGDGIDDRVRARPYRESTRKGRVEYDMY